MKLRFAAPSMLVDLRNVYDAAEAQAAGLAYVAMVVSRLIGLLVDDVITTGATIEADVNGDGLADLVIGLTTESGYLIGAGDFVL